MEHGHEHGAAYYGQAFAVAVVLNLGFVVVEFIYGQLTHSLALLADAGHNLSDVLALLMAWGAAVLAKRAPSAQRTYGLRKATILASLANAVFLLIAVGAIASESVHRLFLQGHVQTGAVMLIAGLCEVLNDVTALLFMRGDRGDLNVRGAFLHMASDAMISLAV